MRNLHTVFLFGYTNLHSHQWGTSFPFSPRLWPHLLLVSLMITVLTVRCGFDLPFPDNSWYFFSWASIHVSVHNLCVFFGKMSIWILCLFLNFFFLMLSYMSSLYILDILSPDQPGAFQCGPTWHGRLSPLRNYEYQTIFSIAVISWFVPLWYLNNNKT